MATTDHPDPQQIDRVLRCQATAGEVRAVVRHLLRGCERCAAASPALTNLVAGPTAEEARAARSQSHRFKSLAQKQTPAGFWVRAGLIPMAATGLVRAGILSLEDLARLSREDLLAIRGVGEESLARCEALLGWPLPSIKSVWKEAGLALITAHALHRAGIDSLEKLAAQTRESFLAQEGLGEVALRTCEAILGRKLDSPAGYWREHGLSGAAARALARARVQTLEELTAMPVQALAAIGLRETDVADCWRLTTPS
jgi:hypothetical protein